MATFSYRAYDAEGRLEDGLLEAASHGDALEALRARGLNVEFLQPERRMPYVWRPDTVLTWEDIHLFSAQLASLARTHLPLAPGIRAMALDIRRPRLKRALRQLEQDLENGHSLSGALDRQKDAFPQTIISMLRSGETAGNLPAVLHLCTRHSRRMADLKQGLKTASVYPLFLLFVGVAVLGFMMVYVTPQFGEVYEEFGGTLPASTQLLLRVSEASRQYWPGALVVFAGLFVFPAWFLKRAFQSRAFGEFQDYVYHTLPMYRAVHYRVTLARFFQTLATLLHARVPIVESLRLAGAASGSRRLQSVANEIALQQENGFDLSQAMAISRYFTNHMCWLVSMGEKNNDLERALESLAEALERESRGLDNMMMSLATPLMTVIIGLIFAFIMIALYQPIFTLGNYITGG